MKLKQQSSMCFLYYQCASCIAHTIKAENSLQYCVSEVIISSDDSMLVLEHGLGICECFNIIVDVGKI